MALKQQHESYMAENGLMFCQNSDNDTGTFRNTDIPSFEIQTKDLDNPPYRALLLHELQDLDLNFFDTVQVQQISCDS